MSWSKCQTSNESRFGSRSALLEGRLGLHLSVSLDTLESWSIEMWYYKTRDDPCTLLGSDQSKFSIMVNRRGQYILRFSSQHEEDDSYRVSRVSDICEKNNTWNHLCVQYSRALREYTLFSNGHRLIIQKESNLDPVVFHRLYIGSYGFHGNIDSVRVSSIQRYVNPIYDIPVSHFSVDPFTLALNDFEEPVFIMDDSVVQTEKNWYNISLNKTQSDFMTGTKSLIVGTDTGYLPGFHTPGVDMNSTSWTVEFFFKSKEIFDDKYVLLKRGVVSISVLNDSIRVINEKRIICRIKHSVEAGRWYHVFLSHNIEERVVYLGFNGVSKKCGRYPDLEMGEDIVVGSIGLNSIYYDSFRVSSEPLYGKRYMIPHPVQNKWSCLDPNTLLYTGFEEPDLVASNITSFSVLLTWKPIESRKKDKYIVYMNGIETRQSTIENEFNVYGLDENTEYEFSIFRGGKKIHKSISIKTLKMSKDNSYNVLSSISTKGKYDVSMLPSAVLRNINMHNVFGDQDVIIVPVVDSSSRENKVVARFASLSSTVDVSSPKALLVPFEESGQSIEIKGSDGTTKDVSFIDGSIEIDGMTIDQGGYHLVGGRKMIVRSI